MSKQLTTILKTAGVLVLAVVIGTGQARSPIERSPGAGGTAPNQPADKADVGGLKSGTYQGNQDRWGADKLNKLQAITLKATVVLPFGGDQDALTLPRPPGRDQCRLYAISSLAKRILSSGCPTEVTRTRKVTSMGQCGHCQGHNPLPWWGVRPGRVCHLPVQLLVLLQDKAFELTPLGEPKIG